MTELKETENAADMAAEAESTGAAGRVVPPEEAADYEEFRRRKRAIELRSKLRGLEPTLLRQDASLAEVRALCERAKRFSAACVCVQPVYAAVCRDLLKDSGVAVSCVVGGNSESLLKTKLCEETACLRAGAAEVEFYPSVSAVVNGNFAYFRREVRKAVRRARGRTVKVALDGGQLPRDKFLRAARIAVDAGARYLSVRAEEEFILLLRQNLENRCEIKARGVETAAAFCNMLALGCARMGSEEAGDILRDMEEESGISL